MLKCFRPFMNQVWEQSHRQPGLYHQCQWLWIGRGQEVKEEYNQNYMVSGHGWQGSPGQNIVTSLVSAWKSETRLQVQGVSNKCSIFYFCERKKLDTSCAPEVFVNLADHAFDEISKNSVPPLVNLSQLTTVRTSLGNAGIIKCLVESNMADK